MHPKNNHLDILHPANRGIRTEHYTSVSASGKMAISSGIAVFFSKEATSLYIVKIIKLLIMLVRRTH